jgi:hypothetical protein
MEANTKKDGNDSLSHEHKEEIQVHGSVNKQHTEPLKPGTRVRPHTMSHLNHCQLVI